MNDRQKDAIENHCRFGFETCQKRFNRYDEATRVSTQLTVNSGYE